MKNVDIDVLLVEPDKKQSDFLTDILTELDFGIITARSVDAAIQKLLHYSPSLVICQKELKDGSGFLLFSMLRNNLADHKTPFILLINNFDKTDVSLGIEMGIDSFLFPPFEREKVLHIVQHQLEKNQTRKMDVVQQFTSLFSATPFGMFICKNREIIKENQQFSNLIGSWKESKTKFINDVFDFNANNIDELNLLRCLNGVTKYCSFRSIALRLDSGRRFNLFLNRIDFDGSSVKLSGLIIPSGESPGVQIDFSEISSIQKSIAKSQSDVIKVPNDNGLFTSREKQILKLSAQGAPIKQIANRLGISARTVEKHRSNIFKKAKAENIAEAIYFASKKKLLEID